MGFFDKVKGLAEAGARAAASNVGGSASLREAYLDKKAPNKPGVYRLYHNGQLMKVGKATDGLRKRFSDYYRGMDGGTAPVVGT